MPKQEKKLYEIRKYQENLKNFIELQSSVQPYYQNEDFVNTTKKLLTNRNWTFPLVRYFSWKLEFASNILSMVASTNRFLLLTRPGPFKLNLFNNFGDSKVTEHNFNLKIEELSPQKVLNLVLLDNYSSDLFTEV